MMIDHRVPDAVKAPAYVDEIAPSAAQHES